MGDETFRLDDRDRVLRMAEAVGHQFRLDVLLAHANGGPASATKLAQSRFPASGLGNVSYHQVRLRELGVLEEIDSRRSRGATERIYGLSAFGIEVLKTVMGFGGRRR